MCLCVKTAPVTKQSRTTNAVEPGQVKGSLGIKTTCFKYPTYSKVKSRWLMHANTALPDKIDQNLM